MHCNSRPSSSSFPPCLSSWEAKQVGSPEWMWEDQVWREMPRLETGTSSTLSVPLVDTLAGDLSCVTHDVEWGGFPKMFPRSSKGGKPHIHRWEMQCSDSSMRNSWIIWARCKLPSRLLLIMDSLPVGICFYATLLMVSLIYYDISSFLHYDYFQCVCEVQHWFICIVCITEGNIVLYPTSVYFASYILSYHIIIVFSWKLS